MLDSGSTTGSPTASLGGEQLERRRLPDRPQHRPGDDPRRPAPGDRGPPGRRSWRCASSPTIPGNTPPILPAGLARAAARRSRPPPRARRAPARPAGRRPQRRERVGEPRAVGQRQLGVELEQRREHEAAAGHLGVRQGQALGLAARGRRAAAGRRRAGAGRGAGRRSTRPRSASIALQTSSSSSGSSSVRIADRRVEEVGLVEDLADRLGLVGGGDRLDLDPVLAEQLDRRPQVAGASRRRWSRGRGSRSRTGLRPRGRRPRPRRPRARG